MQHPFLKIVMVFSNPDMPVNKGSKTTYGDFCLKLGVPIFKASSEDLAAYIAQHES